ncbi:uncharacterized protein [Cicer arietinum]|uniref:uncharacterized protein n=1 Tax=Cicer arietinum TaxID=3827 RepID=UPI003CC63924
MSINKITATSSSASDYNKPFQFEGRHFKPRQQNMLFFLTTKKLANVLKDDIYVVPEKAEQIEKDKKVWDALKKKYDTGKAGNKKYVVSGYLKYQMTYDISVEAQSHEIKKIAREIISEESLMTCLKIEEESQKQDQKDEVLLMENNKKNKFIGVVLKPKDKQLKNQNLTLKNSNKNRNPQMVSIIRHQPPPRNDPLPRFLYFHCGKEGWWIDIGASRHVCYDRAMFKTYAASEYKKVLLGYSHTTNVACIGDVELIFTFGKTLILKDVMHTPEIKKNMVFGFLLNKAWFTQSIGAYL